MANNRIVIGITGGTGIVLAHRAIELLIHNGYFVDLILSSAAVYTAQQELGRDFASAKKFNASFPAEYRKYITTHPIDDIGASIASGSFVTAGMAIIPCSMATLAAVAVGIADNLIRRAADVTLKEKRRLVIVPRECPLSEIHLENMLKLARAGAVIAPPMPAWYHKPKSMKEMEEAIVTRVLDSLGVKLAAAPRWEGM